MTAPASTGGFTSFAMVAFTFFLACVSCQQSEILESQRQIQAAATRSNIAPAYGGESTDNQLILKMTNTGDIPARNVTVSESHKVLASDDGLAELCKAASLAGHSLTIHPGATIEHHLPALTDVDVKKLQRTGRRYYACGTIRYRDELGEGVSSGFCFSVSQKQLTEEGKKNLDHTICAPPEPEPTADCACTQTIDTR